MSVLKLHGQQYAKTLDTSETIQAAGFQVAQNQELAHVYLWLYRSGVPVGNEKLYAAVYTDSGYTDLYALSDPVLVRGDIAEGAAWYGKVRFDFARPNLNKNLRYYLAVYGSNYSKTPSFYVAFPYDWPAPIYTQASAPKYGLRMELYGYRTL
jgi:hypothetical protein